jgi:biopolymer transport protein ExbD
MAAMTATDKRAHRRAKNGATMDMNLVSLIDVFTILIFFLLSSATGVETLVSPQAVNLPVSTAEKEPKATVLLVVSGDDIVLDGQRVASVKEVTAQPGDVIANLQAELQVLGQRKAVLAENKADQQSVTIMADKQMPYSLLRKLMFTCARANFADVSFAVRKKDF